MAFKVCVLTSGFKFRIRVNSRMRPFYDVMGLGAFSSLQLVGFVGLGTIRVRDYEVGCIVNPNSHAPFFTSRLSPRKERVQKMEVPLDSNWGLPHHNALSTYGTPLGCRCLGTPFCSHMRPLSMM